MFLHDIFVLIGAQLDDFALASLHACSKTDFIIMRYMYTSLSDLLWHLH